MLPDIEVVSAAVHAAWMDSKRAQGVTTRKAEDGEELMAPYEQLSEKAKQLDRGTVQAVYAAINASASENEPRLWKSRIDCWYEPHRDPGAKVKPNKRVVRYVILEAPTSDEAVTRAVEWAERTADCSKGRRWLSFEHRQTGPFKIPQEVKE